ncbi:NACHT domain-containing protein [Micromonospora zamorensis]|uniref:NACHT domain-containing protein n=1 Tax=Micromonospora zamorensis TaxID=709883 RepID=UPI0033EC10E1
MAAGLNWDIFAQLPGGERANFERLCRAVSAIAYSRYGRFAAKAQQPGVEFHLLIQQPNCPLGEVGRGFGWQTKWFDIPSGRSLNKTQRNDIVDSLEKTEKHEPWIRDWVLWTRRPLTAGDQKWFYGLRTSDQMHLHLWTEDNLDTLLTGDAMLLRETYFGQLILTPQRLAELHALAAEEIRPRWLPEVHQISHAEQRLRRMLAEPDAWLDLDDAGMVVTRYADMVAALTPGMPQPVREEVDTIVATGRQVADLLAQAHEQLREGRTTSLTGAGRPTVPASPARDPAVLRRLRSLRHPAAAPAVNLVAYLRDAVSLAETIDRHLTARVVVVTGDAGFGKTQLAATLTAPSATRPGGVLLFGRHLAARGTLDDLAHHVTIAGTPLATFDSLLAAVDAAAVRTGCRLPIVIDGLNEAETATAWKPLLNRLDTMLQRYPSVMIICTIRGSFLEDAVPETMRPGVLTLDGFDADLDKAIDRYFTHYKIEATEADLPRELLKHPLSLKIFCDVANPTRAHTVSADRLPRSLTAMFDKYVAAAADRLAELYPVLSRQDVTDALDAFGDELWTTRQRDVPEARAKQLFNDENRRWNETLLTALEREGIVVRQTGREHGKTVSLAYDLLAGHLVAASLMNRHGTNIVGMFGEGPTEALFIGDQRHPLAVDIFDALAGTMPRFRAGQLWQAVGPNLRGAALRRAVDLEADYLDKATIEELTQNIDRLRGEDDIFGRLYRVHAAPKHPLNATFLDTILRNRSVADRDLRWSEWLRTSARRLLADTRALAAHWRESLERSDKDHLRAHWLMWTLTTTDRTLRDAATATLYWYGRQAPAGLFTLTSTSLALNDAYISERMTAAAYGVATTRQSHEPAFEAPLRTYLQNLLSALTGPAATAPTYHALTRLYVSSTFAFAHRHYPAAVPAEATEPLAFAPGATIAPLRAGDSVRDDADRSLEMDFRNYTLGALFPDRRNYDDTHAGHRDATDHLLGVVHTLGWTTATFEALDRKIRDSRRFERDGRTVERYGKKYGWIGLRTVAGMLADTGSTLHKPEVDIDPTFPDVPPPAPVALNTWARQAREDDYDWLCNGTIEVSDEFLTPATLEGAEGPWILFHANLEHKDLATGRSAFGLFNTILVDPADLDRMLQWMNTVPSPGRDVIDLPGAYYTFAGDIPWHPRFPPREAGEALEEIYGDALRLPNGLLRFERLAHHFTWESYHSEENQANAYIPSRLVSDVLNLHSAPEGFNQVDASGSAASRSYASPPGFNGSLLYVRADLARRYAGDRALITFGWGERNIQFTWPDKSKREIQELRRNHYDVWRIIVQR